MSKGFWLDSEPSDSAAAPKVHGFVWTYGRPVPVTLEFTEWSKTQSELGVCRALSRGPWAPCATSIVCFLRSRT